jgi:hypothetical protein
MTTPPMMSGIFRRAAAMRETREDRQFTVSYAGWHPNVPTPSK